MLIFLVYESVTTPFCLLILLSACGILPMLWRGEDFIQNFAKAPVDNLVGHKRRAFVHWEVEMDTMTPLTAGSC